VTKHREGENLADIKGYLALIVKIKICAQKALGLKKSVLKI
jgi:hypothetical protein